MSRQVVTAIIFVIGTAVHADEDSAPVFRPSATVQIELQGTVDDYVEAVIENWLLRVPRDNPAILEMFADRDQEPYRNLLPWSGEFAGKYLTSLVQNLRLTGNNQLRETGERFVDELISLQADDGYLGPFPKQSRLTGVKPDGGRTWDAWGHYHIMMGLLLWYDHTGDENALNCVKKIGDLFCERFLDTGKKLSSTGSTEMNLAVVHSLALLYQRTEEPRYLELAHEIVRDFSAPNAGNYLQAGLEGKEFYQIPKPRWESLHPLMGLAELYWIDGNEDYRQAFEHFWWSIVKLDRHNNGGFSSGERAHGDPYHPGPIETCCTVAWMAMSVEMLKMTGDSRVADELEHSTLNQSLGIHSPDGSWCTYNTPMNGRRVPSTVDIAFQIRPGSEELNCCSVNAARTFGMIADWAVMKDREGLILNWYGPSTFEDEVGGTPVRIRQMTEYPREGKIQIQIDPEIATEFALKLRIPHWSAETKATLNGEAILTQSGSYLVLQRKWKPGDQIELELDMSLRYWKGERAYAGKASVYRGPLLLAYEEKTPAALKFSDDWGAFGHFRAAEKKGAAAEFAFRGDSLEWHGFYMDDAGKTRVIIDGEEIAVVDQYGPQRDKPFLWKHAGLGSGEHVARFEVLGEKQPDSKGVWVNIQDLKSTADIPEVDAETLAKKHSIQPVEPGFLLLNAETTKGKAFQLRDYASVGLNGRSYFSWLPIEDVPATPFSRENPSRTAILETP